MKYALASHTLVPWFWPVLGAGLQAPSGSVSSCSQMCYFSPAAFSCHGFHLVLAHLPDLRLCLRFRSASRLQTLPLLVVQSPCSMSCLPFVVFFFYRFWGAAVASVTLGAMLASSSACSWSGLAAPIPPLLLCADVPWDWR